MASTKGAPPHRVSEISIPMVCAEYRCPEEAIFAGRLCFGTTPIIQAQTGNQIPSLERGEKGMVRRGHQEEDDDEDEDEEEMNS